jgi:hypothetical protein
MWIAPQPAASGERYDEKQCATPKIAEVARLQQKQNASAVSTASLDSSCYRTLLEQAPILEDEDQELYKQIHDAVFEDVRPQTFLEKLAVKDFADKVFEELRLKTAIVDLIDGARQAVVLGPDEEREFSAIQDYLPHLQKLQRMKDNSEAGRRALMKEFRHKAGASKGGGDPETSAKTSTKTSKPK